jgi:FtsH-binding integral membrane protein
MGFSRYSALPATGLVRSGEERATLVRRTYALVFAGVLVSTLGTWFAISQQQVMIAVGEHPFISMLLAFAPLFLAQRARDRFPQNIGLVFLFTFVMGVIIAPLIYALQATQPGVVGQAGALTLSTFGVLTIYAWLSRRDFSAWGGFFITGLWVVIGTSLLNLFFHNQTANLWIAAATVFVFSGLLVFDTWRLRNVYGPNDYVMAGVNLYLDLLNMFVAILSLLGGGRRN